MIDAGPMAGVEAIYRGETGAERVIILLNLLGRKNYISVEREDHHFGGFYFDLDLLLASRLDELTVHACVFPFERLTWTPLFARCSRHGLGGRRFILQVMGADFYPRLVGVSKDNPACNRLVNEQAQVSLLLAGPGVIATLTFAPLIVALFYGARFAEAVEVLRWICLGMALRVITWPMGFIIVAKNGQLIFFGADLAWTIVNVGVAWLCVTRFGVNGAGMAFFGSYAFHGLLIYPIVRALSGFRCSAANRKGALAYISLIAGVFCGVPLLPAVLAYGIGTLALILSALYSIRVLLSLVSWAHFPRRCGDCSRWCHLHKHAGLGEGTFVPAYALDIGTRPHRAFWRKRLAVASPLRIHWAGAV